MKFKISPDVSSADSVPTLKATLMIPQRVDEPFSFCGSAFQIFMCIKRIGMQAEARKKLYTGRSFIQDRCA